jgi:hypothetical protein
LPPLLVRARRTRAHAAELAIALRLGYLDQGTSTARGLTGASILPRATRYWNSTVFDLFRSHAYSTILPRCSGAPSSRARRFHQSSYRETTRDSPRRSAHFPVSSVLRERESGARLTDSRK